MIFPSGNEILTEKRCRLAKSVGGIQQSSLKFVAPSIGVSDQECAGLTLAPSAEYTGVDLSCKAKRKLKHHHMSLIEIKKKISFF